MATLTPQQRDIIIRTVAGEAADQGERGQAAVAWNILNRANDPRWPSDPQDVALQRKQYSTWNRGAGGNSIPRSISPSSSLYQSIGRIVDGVWGGTIPDPTNGAVYYGNVQNAKAGWGSFLARQGNVSDIGAHTFAGRTMNEAAPPIPMARPMPFGDVDPGQLSQTMWALGFAPQEITSPNVAAVNAQAEGLPVLLADASANNRAIQFGLDNGMGFDAMADIAPYLPSETAEPAGRRDTGYRQRAERNLADALAAPPTSGFDAVDLMTLQPEFPIGGRPDYADQSLPLPPQSLNRIFSEGRDQYRPMTGSTAAQTPYERATEGTGERVFSDFMAAHAAPPPLTRDDFDARFNAAASPARPGMSMGEFDARFAGAPDTSAYTKLTGATIPTADDFLSIMPGMMPGMTAAPPPVIEATPSPNKPTVAAKIPEPRLRPTMAPAAPRGGLGTLLGNPVVRAGIGYALGGPLGALLGAGSSLMRGGGGGLMELLGGGQSNYDVANLSNVKSGRTPGGNSYSTGTNPAGQLVTTDQWGNSWINNPDGTSTMLY